MSDDILNEARERLEKLKEKHGGDYPKCTSCNHPDLKVVLYGPRNIVDNHLHIYTSDGKHERNSVNVTVLACENCGHLQFYSSISFGKFDSSEEKGKNT